MVPHWLGLVAALVTVSCFAVVPSRAAEPPTGAFTLSFGERLLDSDRETMYRRIYNRPLRRNVYEPSLDIRQVEFRIFVPEKLGERQPGLLIWLGHGLYEKDIAPWQAMLETRGLIGVRVASPIRNARAADVAGLSLEAISRVGRTYALDRERIYVGGHRGDEAVAAIWLGLAYPDTVGGVIVFHDARFYERVRKPEDRRVAEWNEFARPPSAAQAIRRVPFVFLLSPGAQDRERIDLVIEHGFRAAGYRCHVVEIAERGENVPHIEQAVEFFDSRGPDGEPGLGAPLSTP